MNNSIWGEAKPIVFAAGSTTVMFTGIELALKVVIAVLTIIYLSIRIYRMFAEGRLCARLDCKNRKPVKEKGE